MVRLYLEYYKGYTRDKTGNLKHKREMENLNIKVFEFPKNAEQS
ncbi:MAG: hypothetical protein ABI840_11830 [bacterium]